MADSDYNAIKPIDSLHNITGLSPVKQRDERRRRQDSHQQENQEKEESVETPDGKSLDEKLTDDDQHLIDYCA
jgi:hypothetical protein